jgi:hypothetical protein
VELLPATSGVGVGAVSALLRSPGIGATAGVLDGVLDATCVLVLEELLLFPLLQPTSAATPAANTKRITIAIPESGARGGLACLKRALAVDRPVIDLSSLQSTNANTG